MVKESKRAKQKKKFFFPLLPTKLVTIIISVRKLLFFGYQIDLMSSINVFTVFFLISSLGFLLFLRCQAHLYYGECSQIRNEIT